jgi:hypothetical protein
MRDVQLPAGAIGQPDIELLQVTDDADEVCRIVKAYMDDSPDADTSLRDLDRA